MMNTMASASAPQPDLEVIFSAMNAYQISMALKGALDLALFTHIDEGASTVQEIARRSGATEKGVRVVCDFLTIHGHLTKEKGEYSLPLNSKFFLSKKSPNYAGTAVNFLNHPWTIRSFSDIAGAMLRGGAIGEGAIQDESLWVEFARSMTGVMGGIAHFVSLALAKSGPAKKVLDVSAGHGMYGIALAQVFKDAEVTGLDTPAVMEVAQENAARLGVGERYRSLPGSAFDVDLGFGYDLVVVANFIHHFDTETNIEFLKRVRAALAPGGRLAVIEFIPNEDRVSPPTAAAFSLTMLGAVPDGDAYTFKEIAAMVTSAGFKDPRLVELPPTPSRMVVAAAS